MQYLRIIPATNSLVIIKPSQTYQHALKKTGNGLQQHRRPSKNVEIISVINFIEETMKKINRFGEQLKIKVDSNLYRESC